MVDQGSYADSPILEVNHSELKKYGDSYYKSECPVCNVGLLHVRRNKHTHIIEEHDQCIYCGQRVKYKDIEKLRKTRESLYD